MTALNSFYNYLASGKEITTRKARVLFRVENVADLVYRLRNDGISVYTNRVVLADGTRSFAYRIGAPSFLFLQNMKSRHIARARRALYMQALNRRSRDRNVRKNVVAPTVPVTDTTSVAVAA